MTTLPVPWTLPRIQKLVNVLLSFLQILGKSELCLSMRFFSHALISGALYCAPNKGFSRNTFYGYKMYANETNGFWYYGEKEVFT